MNTKIFNWIFRHQRKRHSFAWALVTDAGPLNVVIVVVVVEVVGALVSDVPVAFAELVRHELEVVVDVRLASAAAVAAVVVDVRLAAEHESAAAVVVDAADVADVAQVVALLAAAAVVVVDVVAVDYLSIADGHSAAALLSFDHLSFEWVLASWKLPSGFRMALRQAWQLALRQTLRQAWQVAAAVWRRPEPKASGSRTELLSLYTSSRQP